MVSLAVNFVTSSVVGIFFFLRSLDKDPKTRASVTNLLEHVWIVNNIDDSETALK
jgi:hypothetical protein